MEKELPEQELNENELTESLQNEMEQSPEVEQTCGIMNPMLILVKVEKRR